MYHFVAYTPINNILYELDGLQPAPISHGACTFDEFPDKIIPVLQRRIDRYPAQEIRFNLLAMIRDLRIRAKLSGDDDWLNREQEKRSTWQWENALRRHNFIGFIGETMKTVVRSRMDGRSGGYEKWIDDAKVRTQARIEERSQQKEDQ